MVIVAVPLIIYTDINATKPVSNLPLISDLPFVGREKQVQELIHLLDFEAPKRVVNIYGSPGFGKSHLAIHVGWHMYEKGVNVYYVDLVNTPKEEIGQVLVEKIYDEETVSFDKFLRLIRKRNSYDLVIFDNSNKVLQNQKKELHDVIQKMVKNTRHFKFLITSREKMSYRDNFAVSKVHALSREAACDLLEFKIPNENTSDLFVKEKEELAELTGSVPLALKIVGSLLYLGIPDLTSPADIINELKAEPILTLSHEYLDHTETVNASFSLSYRYLSALEKKIGQLLSNFPGTFTIEACVNVLSNILPHIDGNVGIRKAVNSLEMRSLLEHSNGRYHFHSLIRDYFIMKQKEFKAVNEIGAFDLTFQTYFFRLLKNATDQYDTPSFKESLRTLEEEKHNFLRLFENIKSRSIKCDLKYAIEIIVDAIEGKLLTSRFSYKTLLSVLLVYEEEMNDLWTLGDMELKLLFHAMDFSKKIKSAEAAMEIFKDYKYLYYNKNNLVSRILFMASNLSMELGQHDKSVFYQSHAIWSMTAIFDRCSSEKCFYQDLGIYYKQAGLKSKAAYYLALSLKFDNLTSYDRLTVSLDLSDTLLYIGQKDNANSVLETIPPVITDVVNMPHHKLFQKIEDLISIAVRLHNHQIHEAAEKLEDCVVEVIITKGGEINAEPSYPHKAFLVVDVLYKKQKYQTAVEIGAYAIEHCLKKNQSVVELLVLVGSAKIWYGNVSKGLDDMETALNSTSIIRSDLYWACCFLLVPRLKYINFCFLHHIISGMYHTIMETIHIITVLPLQPSIPKHVELDPEPVSIHPELEYIEEFNPSSREVSEPLRALSVYLHQKFIDIPSSILQRLLTTVKVCCMSLLENSIVQFFINVFSVFVRLNVVTHFLFLILIEVTFVFSLVFHKMFTTVFVLILSLDHLHIFLPFFFTLVDFVSTIFSLYISALLFFMHSFVLHWCTTTFGVTIKSLLLFVAIHLFLMFSQIAVMFDRISLDPSRREVLNVVLLTYSLFFISCVIKIHTICQLLTGKFSIWPLKAYICIARSFGVSESIL